jgi:hypothetical protein
LIGPESLRSEADPIDDDGKLLEYEISHDRRMRRDPDLMRRSAQLPYDRDAGQDAVESGDEDDLYWHALQRPETRQRTAEREAEQRAAAISASIQYFIALNGFSLPAILNSMEEALAGPDAEQWRKGRDKELKGIADRSTWTGIEEGHTIRKRPVTSKWAFCTSWEADGTIKYRCRIVARWFS